MASLADTARERTSLEAGDVEHLQNLVRSWGLLADLSFSDLLLFVPTRDEPARYLVMGHVRATTGQTLYRSDPVGEEFVASERPLVSEAFASGQRVEGEADLLARTGTAARITAVPVRRGDRVVAVLTRDASATFYGRSRSQLERTYLQVSDRILSMVSSGDYPFPESTDADEFRSPRVGDGLVLLDEHRRVRYASPNAVSAMHRLGIHRNVQNQELGDLGLGHDVAKVAFDGRRPLSVEIERDTDTAVVIHGIPLIADDVVNGAVVLLRDVTDLRRRDRLLVSKEATIREIHHRVKNNLQTISSLLRLQARRFESEAVGSALEEAVRRITAISLVHETLAQDAEGDQAWFNEIVRPLVRMMEEGLASPERPVRFEVHGDAGRLPARLAMPLAVVLAELLQNAVDHAFPTDGGTVRIDLDHDAESVRLRVVDDGVGIPEGFDPTSTSGLGMMIVRTFVEADLRGSISIRRGPDDGPGRSERPGTVIDLVVPVEVEESVS